MVPDMMFIIFSSFASLSVDNFRRSLSILD